MSQANYIISFKDKATYRQHAQQILSKFNIQQTQVSNWFDFIGAVVVCLTSAQAAEIAKLDSVSAVEVDSGVSAM